MCSSIMCVWFQARDEALKLWFIMKDTFHFTHVLSHGHNDGRFAFVRFDDDKVLVKN